jgi:hypothetical protein
MEFDRPYQDAVGLALVTEGVRISIGLSSLTKEEAADAGETRTWSVLAAFNIRKATIMAAASRIR